MSETAATPVIPANDESLSAPGDCAPRSRPPGAGHTEADSITVSRATLHALANAGSIVADLLTDHRIDGDVDFDYVVEQCSSLGLAAVEPISADEASEFELGADIDVGDERYIPADDLHDAIGAAFAALGYEKS